MIDKSILDNVLPVPELDELVEEKKAELQSEGFQITNFQSGGIFYTLLVICCQIRIELGHLARSILNSLFLAHAKSGWLDLKLSDYSKTRKPAQKTQGVLLLTRGMTQEAVKIQKGHIFKTIKDITGEELRFFALEDAVIPKDEPSGWISIEAEGEGSRYNVPPGQITRSLTYIDASIYNPENWITKEGADVEDDESARARGLLAWADLSTQPIADKYKSAAESVPGVLYAAVDAMHPRGQGTVDIIVTGTAGEATSGLLEAVKKAAAIIAGPYDNVLVKSAETVVQPITVEVTIKDGIATEELEDRIEGIITDSMRVQRNRRLNEVLHADIIHEIKDRFNEAHNVKVIIPDKDMRLDKNKVIIAGEINVLLEGLIP